MNQDSLGNTTEVKRDHQKCTRIGINDLPIEIFILIFANVSPVDLKDLRLVCRKWNEAVSDRGTWIKAFDNRLGTGKIFASATRSNIWISEYFGRMASLRRWAKAKSYSRSYQLVNNSYGHINRVETDFVNDRLLTFSQLSGTVSSCTLTSGKNQVFIPESNLFGDIVAFDVTWNYSCVANSSGGLFLKNLTTSTASGSNQSSIKKLTQSGFPIAAVKINKITDKHKEKCDIVSISQDGGLSFWNIAGSLIASLDLKDSILDLRTDFKSLVVVISESQCHIADFAQVKVITSLKHGLQLSSRPIAFDVDFHDSNIVLGNEQTFKIFHYEGTSVKVSEGCVPTEVSIIDGTIQESDYSRNKDIAGGDGLLYAFTFSDGSVGVCNIRDLEGTVPFKTRIMPFQDDRTPQGIEPYTKVALNSTIIAIGALSDWVHFYDAHSGKYLREGTKISRKFTRNGVMPISKIQFGPTGSCGVIVSDDAIQYFRYGEEVIVKKKPNAPQAVDLKNRRALNQHIKSQMADYNEQEHQKLQQGLLVDKYNGVKFDNEQDELRVALALSASCNGDGKDTGFIDGDDEDLAKAIALSQQCSGVGSSINDEDDQLQEALALSELKTHQEIHGFGESENEGSSRFHQSNHLSYPTEEDSEEEILKKILELSLIEH
ncbi:hypothetical protein JCM33374_g2796 [Metschnikowia sp. JCM 33374]|nr:hypothetical protein JCM33374_g2796 [Metschnikowia sp. JCM 33374]